MGKPRISTARRKSLAALAKTGPKPTPKARATQKPKPNSAPPVDDAPTGEIDDEPARRRKLVRRDSLDAADRALKTKHSHISPERMDAIEARIIRETLVQSNGDVAETIATLGIARKTFYDKLQRHGINRADYVKN